MRQNRAGTAKITAQLMILGCNELPSFDTTPQKHFVTEVAVSMSIWSVLESLMKAVSDPDHARLVVATVVGGIATGATVIQNVSAIAGYGSLADRTREEKDRIESNLTLLAKLQELNTPYAQAACKDLGRDLKLSVDRLARLTERSCEIRSDPNLDLSLLERLFIGFAPSGRRAAIIHSLTYGFITTLTVLVLSGPYLLSKKLDPESYADVVVLTGYCALAFRSWALSERRWRLGYNPVSGFRRSLFILRAPVNQAMMVAQACFWASIFCVADSIEDIVVDAAKGKHVSEVESFLKFGAPLVAAALSRRWAYAELKSSPERRPWRAAFEINSSSPIWWILLACVAELILSLASLFFAHPVFSEPIHTALFVGESAISGVAAFEWFVLSSGSPVPAASTEAARSTSACA